MRVLLNVCGVLAVLTIVGVAAGQPGLEDMKALQGTWRLVKGPGSPGSDERAKNITFMVKFDKMTMTDANPDQKSTKEGTVKLDPKTKVFDWTDEKNGWIGIYELKGDVFKFYAVPRIVDPRVKQPKRPMSFDDKGGGEQLFVLKRDAAEPKENIAQAKKDMEGLQGTWLQSEPNKVVVKGDRLSIIDSQRAQDSIMGIITINPKTKAIDWAMRTGLGAGVTMKGIYELKGDNLRIIFGESSRPKTFDEKDEWLMVLKREKLNSAPKLLTEPEKPAAEKPLEQRADKKQGALAKEPAQEKKEGVIVKTPNSYTFNVALSADGKLLARAGINKVDLWDVASGKQLHTLRGHGADLLRVTFSPDGKTLASITGTWGVQDCAGEVKLWDVATGKERVALKGHPTRGYALAFSPDGKTLASSAGEVKLWDVDTGKEKLELKLGKDDVMVWSLAFSPDGKTLATGTGGGFMDITPSSVIFWDVTTAKERARTLPAHANSIECLRFASDGKTLASVSGAVSEAKPGVIKLWDVATAKERATIPTRMTLPLQLLDLAFTADGKTLTSAMWSIDEKGIWVGLAVDQWELATGKARATHWAPMSKSGVAGIFFSALSADGKTVAWGGEEKKPRYMGTAHVWDVESLPTSPPKRLTGHIGIVWTVCVSADGKRLLTSSGDYTLRLWDADTGKQLRVFEGHTGRVVGAALSADGQRVLSGGGDKTVRLWDATTGQELLKMTGHAGEVWSVAFGPEGQALSAGGEEPMYLWDLNTGKNTRVFTGHTSSVQTVAYSDKARLAATSSRDQSIRLWDLETGKEVRKLTGHSGNIDSRDADIRVCFSSDGKRLVSGSSGDNSVRIWDVETGKELKRIDAPNACCVAFSPDGKRIVSGGYRDFAVRIWDAESGKELCAYEGHGNSVVGVAFFPDGKRIASASYDGTAFIWWAPNLSEEPEKGRTIKQMTRFLIDAKTKGIAKGTGIKQIEILEGTVAKKVLLDAKDTSGKEMNDFNREFVVKSVKMTLADDTVVEGQILLTEEMGKATLLNLRGSGELVSDKGTRTWNAFLTEYDVAADSSPENIDQAKKDLAGLQGTWRVIDMPSQFGPKPDEERLKKLKVVVKGGKMTYEDTNPGQENRYEGNINLDPKTKAFDWTGQLALDLSVFTRMGIYELKGDDLKIFFGGDHERVKNFDGKPRWLLVLKREKPTSPPKRITEPERPVAEKPLEQQADKRPGALANEPDQVKKPGVIVKAPGSYTVDVALSPDGKLLARAGTGETVDLWDVATGKKLHTLKGHTTPLFKVAFSPDGKTLASATGGWGPNDCAGEVKLWDVATGKETVPVKGHRIRVWAMAFSADGKTLATSSDGPAAVKLWDVTTGKEKMELGVFAFSLAFSPDGKTLAMGVGGLLAEEADKPGSVQFWDLTTGKNRASMPGHRDGGLSLVFTPDGTTLVSAGREGKRNPQLKLWDVATAKERATLAFLGDTSFPFFPLVFTADGNTLISAMWIFDEKKSGLCVQHWELATGKARATFWAPFNDGSYNAGVYFAALSADGKTVAWGGVEEQGKKITGTAYVREVQSLANSPPKLPEDPKKIDPEGAKKAAEDKKRRMITVSVIVLISAKTEGISEGAKIKRIDTPKENTGTRDILNAKVKGQDQPRLNGTWLVKTCTVVLADGKSLEKREVLFGVDFEQQAFKNLKYVETCQAQSNQGVGTWHAYTAECQTPAPENTGGKAAPTGTSNAEAAKKEMERLQGTWQLVAAEVFGQGRSFKGPKEEVALEKVIIKGDNWTLRRAKVVVKSGIERKETEQQARYELDPTKKPKTIDLVWTDGDEKGKTYPGVYLLDGDTLKICYAREGTERPTGFTAEATKQIKDHCVLMVLKREKVDKSDLENMQGPWLAVAFVIDGKEWPNEKLKQATMFIYGNCLRLEGSIDGEPGWYGGDITLDPARRSKEMDCKEESMNPKEAKVYPGIYQLDGDTLKICMAVNVKERPGQFAGGKGLLLLTFQRGKEILHTPEQKKAIAAIKKLGGQTGTSQFRHIEKGQLVVENWPGKPVVLVYLEETKVTDSDLALLKVFPDLRRLDLTTTSISDAGLIHLKGLTKLELVSLARTKVTDAKLEHLQDLVNLKMLFLGQTKVGDPGLIHLKNLKQLDFLVLEKTQVTDAGLAHLKGLTNLTRLFLDNTKITDAGLAHLERMTKLQFLELGNTKVTDEGVKNLRNSLPKLEGVR